MSIPTELVSATVLAAPGTGEVAMRLFRNLLGWAVDLQAQKDEDPGVWNLVPRYGQPGLRILQVGATIWEETNPWPRITLSVPDAETAVEEIKTWARQEHVAVKSTYAHLRRVALELDCLAARIWLVSREPVIWKNRNDWTIICTVYIPQFLAANCVLEVVLPPEEFARLEDGGLEELKRGVSPEAAELLWLQNDYEVTIEGKQVKRPVLLLCRTGRCR